MAETYCLLNDEGETARQELLRLLKLDYPRNATAVATAFGINRGKTASDVLKNSSPFTEGVLILFFSCAIRKFAAKSEYCRSNAVSITNLQLRQYFEFCCRDKENTSDITLPSLAGLYRTENPVLCSKSKLDEALDMLNCSKQVADFRGALQQSQAFYSFSVVAPTPTAQDWLLKRLVAIALKKFGETRGIYEINLSSCLFDRHEYFTSQLSKILGIEQSQVLENLYGSQSLTILIVRGLKEREMIQENFFRESWKYFNRLGSQARQPKIIIFWVGDCRPRYPGVVLTEQNTGIETWLQNVALDLTELNEINQTDISDWIRDYEIPYPFLSFIDIPSLVESDREWRKPEDVLTSICCQLDIKGGINEIKKSCKWNLS